MAHATRHSLLLLLLLIIVAIKVEAKRIAEADERGIVGIVATILRATDALAFQSINAAGWLILLGSSIGLLYGFDGCFHCIVVRLCDEGVRR